MVQSHNKLPDAGGSHEKRIYAGLKQLREIERSRKGAKPRIRNAVPSLVSHWLSHEKLLAHGNLVYEKGFRGKVSRNLTVNYSPLQSTDDDFVELPASTAIYIISLSRHDLKPSTYS